MKKIDFKSSAKEYIIILTLFLISLTFAILSPSFLTTKNIITVIRQVSMLGVVASGVSFVMIAGGMDLSIGSIMSISCVSTAFFMVEWGIAPVVAGMLGITLATCCGILNGVLGVFLNVHPLIVTLGTMTALKGCSYAISGGLPINNLPDSFAILGQGYVGFLPIPVIILIVYALITSFVLNKTTFGRNVYALGGNDEASRLAGINVKKMKIMIYAISGFSAGLAGVMLGSRVNSGIPSAGSGYEFDVMTASVLGGISIKGGEGKLSGVIVGVLIIGILSNGLSLLNVGDYYQNIIKGVVLLLAVAFDVLQQKPKRKAKKA